MLPIHVIVAFTRRDVGAELIAEAIAAALPNLQLVGRGYVAVGDAQRLIRIVPPAERCALVLCGPDHETAPACEEALDAFPDLAVLRVNELGDVRIGATLHGLGHAELFAELRAVVERVMRSRREAPALERVPVVRTPRVDAQLPDRPLLSAAVAWIHATLRGAVEQLPEPRADGPWSKVTRESLLQEMNERMRGQSSGDAARAERDRMLDAAFLSPAAQADPLAIAVDALALTRIEFRLLLLVLAPELDAVYQRCAGLLEDHMGRRVGSLGLYASLLGDAAEVRALVERSGALTRWRLIEEVNGSFPAADELLRLDAPFCAWLLGGRSALERDSLVRRSTRRTPWPGAAVLDSPDDHDRGRALVESLLVREPTGWILLGGDDSAAWRALVELGARSLGTQPVRAELGRIAGGDAVEIDEIAARVCRLALLDGRPITIDADSLDSQVADADSSRLFLARVIQRAARAAVIGRNAAHLVRDAGVATIELAATPALSAGARAHALRTAAAGADAYLDAGDADELAKRFPLTVDGIERAMHLARARPLNRRADDPQLERFTAAIKELAAHGISHLAEYIEPTFQLEEVVLPAHRKQQLNEIVDSIRFAARVLDGWKFREQMPYGRGVTALFHGPSGTGKTMAAMGIARRLGAAILRLDLSRVVSKYIGETEKNLDRVFDDAQKSGSAILIDEADALLGKRSEVKDAHDRYANIEVAYLLQRMEAYEGLAILTTNMRQNLDPAFVRRLRFIVEFPRPDVDAREKIWRQCLPPDSHALDDAAFRQLARRLDLTGGHIRQITLRAAFAAAAAETPIGLAHIAHAARAELEKLGMPPIELELVERRRAA